MRPPIALAILAACSASTSVTPNVRSAPTTASPLARTAAPAPAIAPDPDADADAAEEAWAGGTELSAPPEPWQKHACQRSVVHGFIAYPEPQTPEEPVVVDEPFVVDDDMGGKTLDEKLAEINRKRPSAGICDTRHRDKLASDLLTLRSPAPAPMSIRGWDHTTPPRHRDLVRSALALTPSEEAQLARDGFVVPERLSYGTYTTAYYDVHRAQLPVFVSLDSILHTVYASHDMLFGAVEERRLIGELDSLLGALHCGLPAAAKHYPKEVAEDLDQYLTVARSLLAGQHVPSELGPAGGLAAAPLLAAIERARGTEEIELFGRRRNFDASQFTPRGHYAASDFRGLDRYFRAAMWLSRVELNLVSRDTRSSQPGDAPDPSETPREAVVALALADLAQRTGALKHVTTLDRAWASIAGKREDVSLAQLLALRKQAGITTLDLARTPAKLRTAIGTGFVRTTNLHPNPAVTNLPVIATVLGPRITPGTQAMWSLAKERGPDLRAAEIGFMLGHDRALAHLAPTAEEHARLVDARRELAAIPAGDDLYTTWLAAIRALADKPRGAMPAFMDTAAYQDLRLDTALVAYGQLRHNHVLVEAQLYDQGGCEIPDGYVEPAPATYRALAAYAKRGQAVFRELDPAGTTGATAYFRRLERLMRVLAALSDEQLANRPLSAQAKRFLAMIVERRDTFAAGYGTTTPLATFDGWYMDLFPNLDVGLKDAAFVADYATYDRDQERGIHYLGAKRPRLGVFVVDAGGAPRLMVGPVADGFGHTGPLDRRLTDDEAELVPGEAPWAKSYTAPDPGAPAFAVSFERDARRQQGLPAPDALPTGTLRIETAEALGKVTIEFLDHHFVAMDAVSLDIAAGRTELRPPPTKRPFEAMWIKSATFQRRVDLDLEGRVHEDAPVRVDP